MLAFALTVAILAPSVGASPAASPSPVPSLKTITTVKSTAFCSAIAQHFNGAARPMIANDYTLEQVGKGLDSLGAVFSGPDYSQRFVEWRIQLTKYVNDLERRLPGEQDEINRLRDAQNASSDPAMMQSAHMTAEKMQQAYDHQKQLATDLQGVVQSTLDYDVLAGSHPMLGENNEELNEPPEMKELKTYLKFEGQRDVIAQSENAAGDIAYNIVTKHCM